MEPYTLFKWMLMEVQADSLQTKLGPNMEQVTVMHNALMISSLFGEKLTLKIGTMIRDTMEPAAPNLTYGKPTNRQMPILPILAKSLQTTDAKAMIVVTVLRDKVEFVIRMDAT
jgi:hypothetical protein